MTSPENRKVGWQAVVMAVGLMATWHGRAGEWPAWQPVSGTLRTSGGAAVSATNAHAEYPRPQLVRRDWQGLNGLWEYAITDAGAGPPTNYDGRILVPFPVESGLSGVGRRLRETNTLWYRRTVRIPPGWAGRRVRLHFGAVDWQARVLVNGRLAGEHRGGYDPFSLDITVLLNWSAEEEILVAVQDPTEGEQPRGKQSRNPEGIFYTPSSGIWQTVWLEPVPRARIDRLQMMPDLARGALRLNVMVNRLADMFRVEAVALDKGVPVARARGPVNADLELQFERPHLWSPEDPFLYDLRVTLFQDETQQDQVDSYFGLRSLSARSDSAGVPRLALNGESLFQVGVLDQGFWPDGLYTAPSDAAWQEELTLVKKLGFNTVRKHVKVEPDRWYYWCDRLGLMVWQDMPSGNNRTVPARRQFEIELQRMVEALRNHPSIIMWVLFNEGWGQYDTARLSAWLKRLDASRLVDSASGWLDKQTGDVADVHSYPGPEAPGTETSRATVLGEFGGVALTVGSHVWSPKTWGYELAQTPQRFTARYTELVNRVWSLNDVAGLSAAIYTQLTDVETECNGLLTYDRAVVKVDAAQARDANLGKLRKTSQRALLAPGDHGRTTWSYTTSAPPPRWAHRGFDTSKWNRGQTGFGLVPAPPGSERARTLWNTGQIWLRRFFVLPPNTRSAPTLRVCHAGAADVYFNGILAASVAGSSEGYVSVPISSEALASLREGLNSVGVHARRSETNQFIDVGIFLPVEHPADEEPPPGGQPP